MITGKPRSRAEFDEHLASLHIRGQWKVDEVLNAGPADGPRPMGIPYLWKWALIREALTEACEVFTDSLTARRSLVLMNPELRGGTTHTFGLGIQLVTPGERAWAHRHTMAAIRFGIEGDARLSTVVDGERFAMEPGDLILTPSLTWHDHHNESDRDGIWLDAIDAPLCGVLGQRWYQPYGESLQPVREREADYVSGRARSVRPAWESRKTVNLPYRYPWRDVAELLAHHASSDGSPHDGVRLEYVNPMTGGPTLPTLGCYVQRLRPGLETREHRHTASTGYFVVKGEGVTVVDGHELRWGERDVFAVPNWTRHRHVNLSTREPAILFSVSDEPLLQAIGLYREDPEPASYLQPPPVVPAELARRGAPE